MAVGVDGTGEIGGHAAPGRIGNAAHHEAGHPAGGRPFEDRRRLHVRREGAGLLLGIGRPDDAPSFGTEVDWSLTEPLIERAVRRAPALEEAGLMRGWAGLYEMTPDQTGIVSAVPGVAGLHVIAGFSGHGFMHGPIAGQLMAEMLVHGRAVTMDATALDLARFARGEAHVEPLTFV